MAEEGVQGAAVAPQAGGDARATAATDRLRNLLERLHLRRPQHPPAAPTPPSDPLVAKIWHAMGVHDQIALEKQGRRVTFALFTAALGPLAILLLAVQALAFPHGGGVAIALIAGELLILATALAFAFLRLTHAHGTWIRERLRAEILRREMFLLRMRVGPYLHRAEPSEHDVSQRLLELDDQTISPKDHLALAQPDGRSWRSELEDQWRSGPPTPIPCLPTCLGAYIQERVVDQKEWFVRKSRFHANRARRWENGAKLVLVLALIVAALHLGALLGTEDPHAAASVHVVLIVTAIILPALGAALVGLLSISGSHRLSRAYRHHARVLHGLETRFRDLEMRAGALGKETDEMVFEFKRLVLRTEGLLSSDLRLWWLVMEPEEPRAGT